MTRSIESAASCPVCLRAWWWESDAPFGIGRIRAVHPPGRCVPPVVQYEPDWKTTEECDQCGVEFVKSMLKQRFCSDRCKAARRRGEYVRRPALVRECAMCGVPFRARSSQKTCSTECRDRRVAWQKRVVRDYAREVEARRRRQGSRRAAA